MPRKTSLNWFIPALVNSSVGSLAGTSEEECTLLCGSSLVSKKRRNASRISFPVISFFGRVSITLSVTGGGIGTHEKLEIRRHKANRIDAGLARRCAFREFASLHIQL